jgi:hypothetical protein
MILKQLHHLVQAKSLTYASHVELYAADGVLHM